MSALDNPVWHALSTAQSSFAESRGMAKRFPQAVSPLAAVADDSARALSDLAALLGPGGAGALFLTDDRTPGALNIVERIPIVQMVCERPVRVEHEMERLGEGDVAEMVELTELTHPGPFSIRTRELGDYFAIRENGRIAAMAGERLRLTGFTEISAVCTHPDFRGRGFASALVSAVAANAIARGDVPFLHVRRDNRDAIRVYERLGFTTRAMMTVTVVQA